MRLLECSVDDYGVLHARIQPSARLGKLPPPMWLVTKLPQIYIKHLLLISNDDIRKCIREVKVIEEFCNTGISVTECNREYVREFYTLDGSFNQQVIVNVTNGYWTIDRIGYKLVWSSFLPLLGRIENFYRNKLKCPTLWIGGEDTIYAFSPYPIKDNHCYFTLVDGKIKQMSLPIPVYRFGRWDAELNMSDFSNLHGETFHEMTMRLRKVINKLNGVE